MTTTFDPSMTVHEYVGGRINQLLWERRLTKTAGAEAIGVTSSTFSKKLRGQVPITVDELIAAARLLEVEVDALTPPTGGPVRPALSWAPRGSNPEPAVWEQTPADLRLLDWVLAA